MPNSIMFLGLVCLVFSFSSLAGNTHPDQKSVESSVSSPEKQKVSHLADLAQVVIEKENDIRLFDSLSMEAINIGRKNWNNDLILLASNRYLNSINREYYNSELESIIDKAELIADESGDGKKKFQTWSAISNAYQYAYNDSDNTQYDKAHEYAIRASNYADTHGPEYKIASNLNLSQTFLLKGNKLEAYETLLRVQLLLEQNEEYKPEFLQELNQQFFKYFMNIGAYKRAAQYKKYVIEDLKENKDHVKNFETQKKWNEFDLILINYAAEVGVNLTADIESIAHFAKEKNNPRLLDHALSLLRTYLIDRGDFNVLHKKFSGEYSDYYNSLQYGDKTDKFVHTLMKAYFSEANGELDSADQQFNSANKMVRNLKNQFREASFLLRHGDYLLRHGRSESAMEKYSESLAISSSIPFYQYQKEASEKLHANSLKNKDYQAAYHYLNLINDAEEEIKSQNEDKRLLLLELDNKEKIVEVQEAKYEEEKKNLLNAQYTLIFIILTTVFMFFIIISTFSVPKWVIEMLGFFNFILIFEFIILLIDNKLHHWVHGNFLLLFLIKVGLIIFLYPLHHYIEKMSVKYMINQNIFKRPRGSDFKSLIYDLWPWLKKNPE